MTDAQMDDIKSFFRVEMRVIAFEVVNELRIELRNEMQAGLAAIADIITSHNDQLDNHEGRIKLLEQRAA